MWKVVVAVVVGIPALYGLYTLFVVLRLLLEARRLERACSPRRLGIDWKLFVMFPVDLEDPISLTVTIRVGERRFSFNVFRSLMSDYQFTRVKAEPVALAKQLGGRAAVDPRDNENGPGAAYIPADRVAPHAFGTEEADARYILREDTGRKCSPDGLALLCSAFARSDVRAEMAAYGGSLTFEYGYLTVLPASRDKPFLDGIEQVARLVDALDDAVKGAGPYR